MAETLQTIFIPQEDGSLEFGNVGVSRDGVPLIGYRLRLENSTAELDITSIKLSESLRRLRNDRSLHTELFESITDYLETIIECLRELKRVNYYK